jgi:hypothetical protein
MGGEKIDHMWASFAHYPIATARAGVADSAEFSACSPRETANPTCAGLQVHCITLGTLFRSSGQFGICAILRNSWIVTVQ